MTPKSLVLEGLEMARSVYLKDLAALSDEQLMNSPGGVSRAPVDFTYEVAVVNRMFIKRVQGNGEPMQTPEGWVTAPDNMKSREAIVAEYDSSMADLIAAVEAVPDDQLLTTFETPRGPSCPLNAAQFMVVHNMYHCGQLNYLQAIHGDNDMHWM
jgi:uncharacterized damage-inducible protein DinB